MSGKLVSCTRVDITAVGFLVSLSFLGDVSCGGYSYESAGSVSIS